MAFNRLSRACVYCTDDQLKSMFLLFFAAAVFFSQRADATLKVTCPDDIDVTADRGLSSAFVSWSRDDFRIHSSNHVKGLYQLVPLHGSTANVRRLFSEGEHYIEYRAVDATGNTASCSFIVTVHVIRCPVLSSPGAGTIRCDAGNVHGSRCNVECQPGFTVVGQPTVECTRRGEWTHEQPHCAVTRCNDPGTPLHGSRDCTSAVHAFGSTCSFRCSHGYQLLGNQRLSCFTNATGLTQWSDVTPRCQEIVAPTVELCPSGPLVHVTTSASSGQVLVAAPRIVFRTLGGAVVAPNCSHFGVDGSASQNFSVGRHVVTCSASDPLFGVRATATCQFTVHVQLDRCQPLKQPPSGFVMCAASSAELTTCRLVCPRGRVLPRPLDSRPVSDDTLQCDRRTGVWSPSDFVPSCVVPRRPTELKLPAELLYTAAFNCSNAQLITQVRAHFGDSLQSHIRSHGACAASPLDCIVDDVSVSCQQSGSGSSSGGRRSARTQQRRTGNRRRSRRSPDAAGGDEAADEDAIAHAQQRRRRHRRKSRPAATTTPAPTPASASTFLSVQFNFATRLPPSGGRWPDEYHRAVVRLRAVYDELENQLLTTTSGGWRLDERVRRLEQLVREVDDSLTDAPSRTICDSGYSFDELILLCVPCGPGSYYSYAVYGCLRCPGGTTQPEQAQFSCR